MKSHSIKEVFEMISDNAFKKTLVEKSGVSNDKMTRLLDPNNGGKVTDLIDVLKSFNCTLCVSHDGKVIPVKVGG